MEDDYFGGGHKGKSKKKKKKEPQTTCTPVQVKFNNDLMLTKLGVALDYYQVDDEGEIHGDLERLFYVYNDSQIFAADKAKRVVKEQELFLVHFGKIMEIKEVDKVLKARGLDFASPIELLGLIDSLGVKSHFLKDFPIVAAKNVFNQKENWKVFCFGYYRGQRYLHLSSVDQKWHKDCRFLAVRKKNVK